MTARLPTPGGDDGSWGGILNTFLQTSHNSDGTLTTGAVQQAGAITTLNGKTPSNGGLTLVASDVGALSSSTTAGGDLTGTYPDPTVAKLNGVSIGGTPGSGKALIASNSTTASWGSVSGATDWLNVKSYGAAGDGSTDDTTAIQTAINALSSNGGVVYFPAGSYKVTSTITVNIAGVTLRGNNRWSTTIYYYGSGDCIRMFSSIGYGNGAFTSGGGIEGLIVDGTHASAGACGAHIGDIYQLKFDFGVRLFKGTGSKGIWFDNQYYWCEDMYGHLFVEQNTSNLIFDNSVNTTGQATGSFARPDLTVVMDAKGVGNGVTIQNGAQLYAGEFNLQGNMDYSTTGTKYWALTLAAPPAYNFTATNGSPCTFTAAGMYYGNGTNVFLQGASIPTGFTAGQAYYVVNTNIGAGTFQLASTAGGSAITSTSSGSGTVLTFQASTLRRSAVNINVECNANQSGTQPGTITFTSSGAATGYNQIIGCTGIVDFTANNPFATSNNSYGNFFFDGPVYGDSLLWRSSVTGDSFYFNGALANNGLIYAQGVTTSVVDTTTNITGITLQSGITGDTQMLTVLNAGTGSITFAAAGTSRVASGTSCVIPANTSMMFQWNATAFRWYALDSLALDTTASDIKPSGVQSAGSSALAAAADHVHQNNADLSLYLAPSGATGETFPRSQCGGYTASILTSGQSYVTAIPLPSGLAITKLAVMIGNTGFSSVSHGWLALLDNNLVVRAVTADQTSSFGSAFGALSLSSSSGYTTTYGGLYYLMISVVATTMGNLSVGTAPLTGPTATAPILAGTSSSSQTTPPSTGTTMGALTASGTWRFYGYTA